MWTALRRKADRVNFYEEGVHTVLLHDREELDDDLGAGSDHALSFARLLGVVDCLESIVEDGGLDHFGGVGWFSGKKDSRVGRVREILKP